MIGYGIVGCGHISNKHALGLKHIENARLVAVCDSDIKRTIPFMEQYGAVPYEKYSDFLADPRVNAVIICTPSGLHGSMGKQAVLAGKHILIEKPFVLNPTEGEELAHLCRVQGVKLGVVHPNRFKSVVKELYHAVSQGWFGKITHASAVLRWNRSVQYFQGASWRGTQEMDGGILFNQAIHNIDLLNWLVGPVEEVFAYGVTRFHDIEHEDVCVSVLKLESGALGVIEAAVTLYPENLEESLAIFGTQGTAVLGGKSLSKVLEWKFSCLSEDEAREQKEILNSEAESIAFGHRGIIQDFTEAIITNHEPLVSGEEALKAIFLIKAIYESLERHQPVNVTNVKRWV